MQFRGERGGVSVIFHTCFWRDIRAVILYTVPHPSPFTVICMKGILLTPPRPLPYRGGESTRDGTVLHFHQQLWKILWWLRFLLLPLQRLQLKQAFEPNLLQTLHLGDFFVQLPHALILRFLFLSLGIQSISIRILLAFHNNLLDCLSWRIVSSKKSTTFFARIFALVLPLNKYVYLLDC